MPPWPLAALAPLSATAREMHAQRHLWREPARLANGALVGEEGLRVTPWAEAVAASVGALLER